MVNWRFTATLFQIILLIGAGHGLAQRAAVPPVEDGQLGQTTNVHRCGELFLAGQPSPEDIAILKRRGIQRVITLRTTGEIRWPEEGAMKDAGLEFIRVPFRAPESLTDKVFQRVRELLRESEKTPTLLHCGSANRVGAVWLAYRVLDQGVAFDEAFAEAKTIGLRNAGYEANARRYIDRAQSSEASVRPGINDNFLKSDLDVDEWLGRFEVESREVYSARLEVLDACQLESGARVADVGAGTGFFARLFTDAVGPAGWVYAVDISPRFLEHINRRAEADRIKNLTGILGTGRSVNLPPDSIDLAFVCDTYHHFEFPQSTLASIHSALKTDGTLVVIDFDRIPGKSREFVLGHVRAGKKEFRGEIEAAGFEFLGEVAMDGLQENYLLRFRKR
jgi:SAM-dependent methyltransferase/protein tyrosine phosphatase (PTP) superfamily phosphohydrolase (DUF442 family)